MLVIKEKAVAVWWLIWTIVGALIIYVSACLMWLIELIRSFSIKQANETFNDSLI